MFQVIPIFCWNDKKGSTTVSGLTPDAPLVGQDAQKYSFFSDQFYLDSDLVTKPLMKTSIFHLKISKQTKTRNTTRPERLKCILDTRRLHCYESSFGYLSKSTLEQEG